MGRKDSEDRNEFDAIKRYNAKNRDLPSLRPEDVLAVVCADLHLSHEPPIARAEPQAEWYLAMGRQLLEMCSVADCLDCPIFIAGDIFDKWNSPPELINFAIEYLQRVKNQPILAIPGQHDLPNHLYYDKHRSAYDTLVNAGTTQNILPRSISYCAFHDLWYMGLPFGFDPSNSIPIIDALKNKDRFLLGVVHRFTWTGEKPWPGCSKENHARSLVKMMKRCNVIVTGDNHVPFEDGKVFNCGGFMRRRFDEKDKNPSIGILQTNGKIVRYYLDCSKDRFADNEAKFEKEQDKLDIDELVEQLSQTYEKGLDFVEQLKISLRDSNQEVTRLVLEACKKKGKEKK